MKLKLWYEKLYNKIFSVPFFKKLLKIPGLEKLLQYEMMSYLVFGVLTTVVNFVVFGIANKLAGAGYESLVLFSIGSFAFKWLYLSNAIAWVCAVTFAYITNRLFVFESTASGAAAIIKEIVSFFGARIISLLLFDELLYALLLNVFEKIKGGVWIDKILVAVLTVVFNYVAGKFVIFKKRGADGAGEQAT